MRRPQPEVTNAQRETLNAPGMFHLLCTEWGEVAGVATEFRPGVTARRIVGHAGAD
jgi:hypothetical protein